MLVPLEFLVKYDVFAGQEEGWRQEIVLRGLTAITLLVEVAFELLEVFAQHIFAA